MKKSNIKLFSLLFAAFAMTATMVSCGNDDNKSNPETTNGGTDPYSGNTERTSASAWSIASFAVSPTPIFTGDEKVTETKDSVFYTSPVWGEGKFGKADKKGFVLIAGRDGNKKSYPATMSGSFFDYTLELNIQLHGTTLIKVIPGALTTATDISKIYTGGEYANAQYFSKFRPNKDIKVVILPDGKQFTTVSIKYVSPTWGEFVFNNVEVSEIQGGYTIFGKGNGVIPNEHGEGTVEKAADIEGTIINGVLKAEIKVPSLMNGGTTICFNPDDFQTVYDEAQQGGSK